MKQEQVLERVYEPGRLQAAWQQVKRNAGAAGIDRMTVEEFASREEELLALIHDKLESGTYRFQPARRVLIPKDGTSKMRKLGIPVVMDRVVGQSMHVVLSELFDPEFTASNYGFRRGKSQHQAIRHVRDLVVEGRDWAVAIDLKSFFDEIPHGLILKLVRRKVSLKGIDFGAVEDAAGGRARQVATLAAGISSDKARELNKFIKGLGMKGIQSQTQGDELRVSGKKRDALQDVIAALKAEDFGIPLQFGNFRD